MSPFCVIPDSDIPVINGINGTVRYSYQSYFHLQFWQQKASRHWGQIIAQPSAQLLLVTLIN